ncbi:MAG TPA: hypothetical protein VK066_24145 [Chloroflexota bacterium]|nr:hypothetical protein [Chloroflexota bacterium]
MPPGRRAPVRQVSAFLAALPALSGAAPGAALQGPGAWVSLAGLDMLTLAVAAGVFLIVEALLLASVFRLWRTAPRETDHRPVRWGWELLWTALPALGLLALAILGAQSLFSSPPGPPASSTPTPVAQLWTAAGHD